MGSVTDTLPESAWQELADAVAGDIVRPGSPDYDGCAGRRSAFEGVRPQAVVLCASPQDVAAAIAFARRAGLPLAIRSGGHCFAGRSSSDGLVVDVSPMRAVSVAAGLATIGAGARLGDVYDALDAHGLTIPAGCGTDVGMAGLTLGGGLGILGRMHGLTSDRLRAAEVVLADGRVLTCDEDRDAELFWALRGAGGARFGVVTSLVFETVAAPPATAFETVWAPGDAAALIAAWQDWAPAAPDELAASLLLNADPDALRVRVFGAMAGSEAETARRLDELAAAAGTAPVSVAVRPGSFREAKRFLAGLGEEGEGEAAHPSASASSSPRVSPRRASRRSSAICSPRTPPATRASSTSRPGAAPTPASRRTRPRSRIATRASCSSRAWSSTRAHRRPSARRRRPGWRARGSSRTRSGPAASTPTSPTPTSTTGAASTTAPTASACWP